MNKRILAVFVVAIAAFALLTGFKGHHGGGFGHIDRILDEIDATDEQRVEIEKIKQELVAEKQAMKAQRQAMKQELVEFWQNPNPDRTAVHAQVDRRIDAMRSFAHKVADAFLEVHQLLTPEQRAEVAQHIEKRAQKHER